jgi:hypothetical protein
MGPKDLQAWAFMNLHESLHNFAQVRNGFFEATFPLRLAKSTPLKTPSTMKA